jgi:hypothetical protein
MDVLFLSSRLRRVWEPSSLLFKQAGTVMSLEVKRRESEADQSPALVSLLGIRGDLLPLPHTF